MTDHGIQAIGESHSKVPDTGLPTSLFDVSVGYLGCIDSSQQQIPSEGALVEYWVLGYIRHLSAPLMNGNRTYINATVSNCAFARIIETLKKAQCSTFSAARCTTEGNGHVFFDCEVQIPNSSVCGALRISQFHVCEYNIARTFRWPDCSLRQRGILRRSIEPSSNDTQTKACSRDIRHISCQTYSCKEGNKLSLKRSQDVERRGMSVFDDSGAPVHH